MLKKTPLLLVFVGYVALAQSFYSGFEDRTPEGWYTAQEKTSIFEISKDSYNYLNARFDGSEEMAIVNSDDDYWSGNYFVDVDGSMSLRTVDDMFLRNPNAFDLYIRLGFEGHNGYKVVTTTPIIIKANSDWDSYAIFYSVYFEEQILDNLTILNDTNSKPWEEVMEKIHDLFSDVKSIKILHNPEIAFEGARQKGSLQMESIVSFEEETKPLIEIPQLTVIPNPFVDHVNLSSDKRIDHVVVYNAQGAKVQESSIKSTSYELSLGQFNSGVYLFEIYFEDGSVLSKQLVK